MDHFGFVGTRYGVPLAFDAVAAAETAMTSSSLMRDCPRGYGDVSEKAALFAMLDFGTP